MILSNRLTTLYAAYRQRLINGPGSVYCTPDPYNPTDTCKLPSACAVLPKNVPFQQAGMPVQFLRQASTDTSQPGAYLVADKLSVKKRPSDPNDLPEEQWPVEGITHGDQTFYASNLFLSLVAEYVITFDDETLGLIESVLAMFQRLGRWQPGYEEEASNPCQPTGRTYGYMLRHDAFDGSEESFCDWKSDPTGVRYLEPSYDQLGTLNNCLAFGFKLLTDPDVKYDSACPVSHYTRIDAIKTIIVERMTSTHHYIATLCRYSLRNCKTLEVARGGGACWMYAYPLARVQGWIRGTGPDEYDQFLETFVWSFLADLGEFFVNQILDGLTQALGSLVEAFAHLRSLIQTKLKNEFGHFLDVATKYYGDILEDVFSGALDQLKSLVRAIVSNDIAHFLRNLLAHMPDNPIWRGLNEAVAISLFQVFSRATLVDPRRELDPKESFPLNVSADLLLKGINLPSSIYFHYTKPLSTPAVTVNGFTIIEAQDFGTLDFKTTISNLPWTTFFQGLLLRFTVPAAILGEIVFSNANALQFMSYHCFTANAAAHSFDITVVNGTEAANRFDSAFFMALMHRFYGQNGPDVLARLATLETAPDGFPKASAPRGWNQDFRWERGKRDPGDPGTLYNGIDFMVATMVAASKDAVANRTQVVDAINAIRAPSEEEQPGVLYLPFEGTYIPGVNPWTIWDGATIPALQTKAVYVGVTFERRDPAGGITLRVESADGTTIDQVFQQGQPARAVQLAPTIQRLTVAEIKPGTKGTVLIGV